MIACVQCEAKTQDGTRCKRKTCRTSDYCFQHLQKIKGLRVKPSHIPKGGLGLYTTVARKKGSKVANYTGDVAAKPKGLYSVAISKNKFMNSESTQNAVGRYANTCRKKDKPKCKGNNAKFSVHRGQVALKATKNIQPGTEVYAAYGRGHRV